jgi:hypothetical protein
MAKDNDMGGWSLVPLDLPPQHVPVLRSCLTDWMEGAREDLGAPERLQNPDKARREVEAFERLLDALASKRITLPDEAAREAVAVATAGDDEASNYKEIAANHDALHALLGVLGGSA